VAVAILELTWTVVVTSPGRDVLKTQCRKFSGNMIAKKDVSPFGAMARGREETEVTRKIRWRVTSPVPACVW
jgi:hypothetical protein